jgi:hypothetical protein
MLKEVFSLPKNSLVSKKLASDVIDLLNSYVNKATEIPKTIKN